MVESSDRNLIRNLFVLYLVLWIFEGALRKWFLPGLSSALLLIRDPVVLAIYFLALRSRIFPWNAFTAGIFVLAGISYVGSIIGTFSTAQSSLLVTLYGLRADFLHLPLIFIMPSVFSRDDVEHFGYWILVLSIPITVLMVMQYSAGGDHWLNAAAGGEGRQIDSVDGKIRPAATFSFITGTVNFLSLVTAFVIYGMISENRYSIWLLCSSAFGLLVSLAVSGSRSAIFSCAIVALGLIPCVCLNRKYLAMTGRLALIGAVMLLLASQTKYFQEGMGTTTTRFENAGRHESVTLRFLSGFLDPFDNVGDVPMLGYGLGMGTNAGAKLLTGRVTFLLAEGEWARLIMESGPLVGFAIILFRSCLMFYLGYKALLRARTDCLALFLFGAMALAILNGQFGQPTIQGFATIGATLCLCAALNTDTPTEQIDESVAG